MQDDLVEHEKFIRLSRGVTEKVALACATLLALSCQALWCQSCSAQTIVKKKNRFSVQNSAQTGDTLPSGGVSLLPESENSGLTLGGSSEFGSSQSVSVSGQPFTRALRLETVKRPENEWALQVGVPTTQAVRNGDVVLARFYVRALKGQPETGEARTTMVFETVGPNYDKSVQQYVGVTRQWQRFDIPFTVKHDSPAGGAQLIFRMGFSPQIIEVANVQLLNFGDRVPVSKLPRTTIRYSGMEANAAWRKEAQARIERIRKGNLAVRVLDASGKPIRNAQVQVRMARHAFPFGSAVASDAVLMKGADGDKYRATIKSLFNRVVIENHLKWPFWETWGRQEAQPSVTWLRQNGLQVRGHVMVWPSWRNSPQDLQGLKDDPTALTKRVNDHIIAISRAFEGQLVEWDVVNEPFDNHDITDILGRQAMVGWFKLARQNDPKARLFINDYPLPDGGDTKNAHQIAYYDTIDFLLKNGAPLQGIGIQCHFGSMPIPPVHLISGFDRFARFKLPIAVTEFDINTQDQEYQTAYTRDFMIAAFSHPAVDSILMWGFWEGRHWMPDAAMYRRDWTIKSNGQAWLDLVKKQWWTNRRGTTNARGQMRTRAFYGNYDIIVKLPNGRTKTVKTKLVPKKNLFLDVKM